MTHYRIATALLLMGGVAAAQTTIVTTAGTRYTFPTGTLKAVSAPLGTVSGVAQDKAGNIYLSDTDNDRVFRISTSGTLTVFAGSGTQGYSGDGMAATSAALYNPGGLAFDSAGNLYICDTGNYRIRAVTPAGVISTFAGNGTAGYSGDGGMATAAMIGGSLRIAFDSAGNLYISDASNHRIRRVDATGVIRTWAGNGLGGYSGDGGPATQASLQSPAGIAFDPSGNLFFADTGANRVRKISNGVISTVAGNGTGAESGDGAPATAASLNGPAGIAVDKTSAVFIADQLGSRVRRIDPATGLISTYAGNSQIGVTGDGGMAVNASLYGPVELCITSAGALLVADSSNFRIRSVSGGVITTLAGNGNYRYSGDGGVGTSASLPSPDGLAVDSSGNVNICDNYANRVRSVNSYGIIKLLAGTGTPGFGGDGGLATSAMLVDCDGIAADANGNLYVADTHNFRIRRISPLGVITTVAGNGTNAYAGDGAQAVNASLSVPQGIAATGSGVLYIADTGNNRIRKVSYSGVITTIAGTGTAGLSGDGGPATAAQLNGPTRITTDSSGNVYFSDNGNNVVRRISSDGVITRVAGNGKYGFAGDGSLAVNAMLANPNGLAVDSSGGVLIADTDNLRVRRVDPSGKISTYAGNGTATIAGDGRAPTTTGFGSPVDVAVDSSGNVYVTDQLAGRVRRIQPVPASLLLSQTGMTFTAAVDGAATNMTGAIKVLNKGAGTLGWASSSAMLSGSTNWLSVSPAQGNSTGSTTTNPVSIAVNPAGLPAGNYYGQIQISSPGIANSPHYATVVLNVLSASQTTGAAVSPASFLFNGVAGGANPAAQTLSVSLVHGNPLKYTATVTFPDANKWLIVTPLTGTVAPGSAAALSLQPVITGLAARVYTATVNLSFSDGSTRSVPATLTVTAVQGSEVSGVRSQAACSPSKLLPALTSIGQGFSASVGWPAPIEVTIQDDCGNPLTSGTVTATFTNGDAPLALSSLQDGTWSATWAPRTVANVTVAISAQSNATPPLLGSLQVSGQLNANPEPPIIAPGGVLNAASFAAGEPAAPGALMSLFGSNLSTGTTSATALPLPQLLSGGQVIVGGLTAPLLYAGPTQINAMIPFSVATDLDQQILVQNGNTLSVPQPITVVPGAPAAFTAGGAPIVVAINADGSSYLVSTSHPAHPGGVIVIYCTGLGGVQSAIRAGQATPYTPLAPTTDPVTLTIGSVNAPVLYAGLVPTFSGLYQVNATIPSTVTPGDNVPLVLTAAGLAGPPVTLSIH